MPVADAALAPTAVSVAVAPRAETVWTPITVQPGESTWTLAQRYKTTVSAIVSHNKLASNGSLIHPGQRLLVPKSAPAKVATTTTPTRADAKAKAAGKGASSKGSAAGTSGVYVVKRGDTLLGIAQRHKTTYAALVKANPGINSGYLMIGKKVIIPDAATKPSTPPTNTTKPKLDPATLPVNEGYTRSQIADLVRATALRHGVDPKLALAIAWQESSWNQMAVSSVGAIGTMQIMPISQKWASQLAGRHLDTRRAKDNITAGVLMLKSLIATSKDLDEAIGSYYQGQYSVRTRGFYSDTVKYIAGIKAHYARM